jgi:hypothetical protein
MNCAMAGRPCGRTDTTEYRLRGIGQRHLCDSHAETMLSMGFAIDRRAVDRKPETRPEGVRRRGLAKMRSYRDAVMKMQLDAARGTAW